MRAFSLFEHMTDRGRETAETNRRHFFFPGGAFFGGRGGLDGAAGLVFGGRRGGGSTMVASNKTALCIRSYFASYLYSTDMKNLKRLQIEFELNIARQILDNH